MSNLSHKQIEIKYIKPTSDKTDASGREIVYLSDIHSQVFGNDKLIEKFKFKKQSKTSKREESQTDSKLEEEDKVQTPLPSVSYIL